jgi:NAD(P)-dependent dehydrogenase (short-subunit alcohol dehydrogenase family)
MDLDLTGKVAVIAGAGGAIGLATTRTLVAEGVHVVAGSRSIEQLAVLDGVTAVRLDLARRGAPGRLIARAVEDHGRIDVLVNNIGPVRLRTEGFLALGDDEFERALQLNFLVVVQASRAALATMTRQGAGAIVNLASVVASYQPDGRLIHYASAKAALVALTQALAQEFGPHGVRVNVVSPGPTAMPGEPPVAQLGPSATGRPTTPDEVRTLVALLSSPRLANVTGANYVIDGGLTKTT